MQLAWSSSWSLSGTNGRGKQVKRPGPGPQLVTIDDTIIDDDVAADTQTNPDPFFLMIWFDWFWDFFFKLVNGALILTGLVRMTYYADY